MKCKINKERNPIIGGNFHSVDLVHYEEWGNNDGSFSKSIIRKLTGIFEAKDTPIIQLINETKDRLRNIHEGKWFELSSQNLFFLLP